MATPRTATLLVSVLLAVFGGLLGAAAPRAAAQSSQACPAADPVYTGPCGPTFVLPGWGDAGGWKDPSQWSTIQLADVDGDGADELFGRTPAGGQWRPQVDANAVPMILGAFAKPPPLTTANSTPPATDWTRPCTTTRSSGRYRRPERRRDPCSELGRPGGSLFVVSGDAGSLKPVVGRGGDFELALRGVGSVTSFSDRPVRRARDVSPARLVRDWGRLGFVDDPPNAALVIDDAPSDRDVLIVELGRPRLVPSARAVRLRARVVSGRRSSALARFRARADRRGPRRFKRASLFIDPSTGLPVNVLFRIENLAQGGIFGISFSGGWTSSSYGLEALQGPSRRCRARREECS
jgi:hypothetical protein